MTGSTAGAPLPVCFLHRSRARRMHMAFESRFMVLRGGLIALAVATAAVSCGAPVEGENTDDVAAQSPPSPSASAQPQAPASMPGEENASKKDEALVVDPCADVDYSNIVDCRSGTWYCYRAVG